MEFSSNKLYPKPEVEKENIEYAKLLLQDYAGYAGEDSAVHLYIFQNLILSKRHPKIANDLFHIAVIEMHHLKLLGETIKLLGLSPEFVTYEPNTSKKHYWSSRNVRYYTSLKEILLIDIRMEQEAIEEYLSHYEKIKDSCVRNLLLRIIEDEKIHLDYFKKQLLVIEKNMNY